MVADDEAFQKVKKDLRYFCGALVERVDITSLPASSSPSLAKEAQGPCEASTPEETKS
jgi:hypothetical protein